MLFTVVLFAFNAHSNPYLAGTLVVSHKLRTVSDQNDQVIAAERASLKRASVAAA